MAGQKTISSTFYEQLPPPMVLPVSGIWDHDPDEKFVTTTTYFAVPMVFHNPSLASFTLKCDGISHTPASYEQWITPLFITIAFYDIPNRPEIVTISYDGSDPLYKSVAGLVVAAYPNFPLTEEYPE